MTQFRQSVSDPAVSFETLTYPELWASWDKLAEPAWPRGHVAALRERYAVTLA